MPVQVPFLILLFLAVESQFVCVLNSLSVLIWKIFSMRKKCCIYKYVYRKPGPSPSANRADYYRDKLEIILNFLSSLL